MKSLFTNILVLILFSGSALFAQDLKNLVYVDSTGIMKWTADNKPAYFFGVNYTAPFAFSYRALKSKGISIKEVIDEDIRHFKRLGLNAFRIHVWDREISDSLGNVLQNEHLELLDYLLAELIKNDIYTILTPIAWWSNGWPELDTKTGGFSDYYSKIESTTKPEVLAIHKNYLKQFVNHVNTFTNKSYKSEAKIIAWEIFNEPNFPKNFEKTKYYVNETVSTLRNEGITKPIFFNISENPAEESWRGVAAANIDGVSFQWYPTGLVKYSELKGNFIPNVLEYTFPEYAGDISRKAKMVYEFDAADIGQCIMYPLMAHSFRKAGMQWATMFSYDPTPLAQFNSEYPTHFLNLLYTPQKAIGFMIANELFQTDSSPEKVITPDGITMGNVFVSYKENLAVLNTGDIYYYTNSTDRKPVDVTKLKRIAGYGNSPIVKYTGTGVYFLDKISDDIWRLEILPDAVWLKDPFGKNGNTDPVARLIAKKHQMTINLQGFGDVYAIVPIDDKNIYSSANNNKFEIEPGVYLLLNKKIELTDAIFSSAKTGSIIVPDYLFDNQDEMHLINRTSGIFREGDSVVVEVDIFTGKEVTPELYIKRESWRGFAKLQFTKTSAHTFSVMVPVNMVQNGLLQYYVTVPMKDSVFTFPGNIGHRPDDWNFNNTDAFTIKIIPKTNHHVLFEPPLDNINITYPNIWRYAEYQSETVYDASVLPALRIGLTKSKESFPEFAVQIYCSDKISDEAPSQGDTLLLDITSLQNGPDSITVRFIDENSNGFAVKVKISANSGRIAIPLRNFTPDQFALLPRPYPVFLPYWNNRSLKHTNIKLYKPEQIQIAFPIPAKDDFLPSYGIKLNRIIYVNSAL